MKKDKKLESYFKKAVDKPLSFYYISDMRTDCYKDKNDPSQGMDDEYMTLLLQRGDEYLAECVSPLKCVDDMDRRLNDVYDLVKNGKLDEANFKYVMQSFSNGYSYHSRKLRVAFDCFNKYIAFDREMACYVSIDEQNLVNYLADNIERADFELWIERKNKEAVQEEVKDNTNEDDLLKSIEEE